LPIIIYHCLFVYIGKYALAPPIEKDDK
jgi:hypothetical protein